MKLPFWPNPIAYNHIDLGLSRVYELLERLDNPHKKLPATIHIAGTNGKGSTLAFLKAIFEDANLKVHSYTSPHLVEFNERIVLAGQEIADDFLNKMLRKCQEAAEIEPKIDVTFFEGITVAAFLVFSKIKADILLLETGMGGRLDATNVIENPIATIITPIAFDHTEFLGNTLAKIAFEKAGIIKPNCPVVISKQKPSALKVLQKVALENNCEVFSFDDFFNGKKNTPPTPLNRGERPRDDLTRGERPRDALIRGEETRSALINGKRDALIVEKKRNELSPISPLIRGAEGVFHPLPNLIGAHQITNSQTAIAAIFAQKKFKISAQNITNGLQKAAWPARLQKITAGKFFQILNSNQPTPSFQEAKRRGNPKTTKKNWITTPENDLAMTNMELILDGSHNAEGAKTIENWLKQERKKSPTKNYLICAMLKDKDSVGFLKHLVKQTELLIGLKIQDETRSKSAKEIATIAEGLKIKAKTAIDFAEAIAEIKKYHFQNYQNQPAKIIICGSLYFAGKFLSEN